MKDWTVTEPVGIGGWLIVVAIAVFVFPFRFLASFVNTLSPIFQDGVWSALTTPGSSEYHPMWAPVIAYELLGNLGFLLGYAALLVLFVKRSKRFPRLFIWLALLMFPFLVIDIWLSSFVFPDQPAFNPDSVRGLAPSIGAVAIWVPYMLLSTRVRNTFIA